MHFSSLFVYLALLTVYALIIICCKLIYSVLNGVSNGIDDNVNNHSAVCRDQQVKSGATEVCEFTIPYLNVLNHSVPQKNQTVRFFPTLHNLPHSIPIDLSRSNLDLDAKLA